MSRYIVIGGAGFIGLNTAKELAKRGHEVSLVDRVLLEVEHENIQCSVVDSHDVGALKSLMPWADGVFHFAAIADIADALQRPYETIQTNVMGTVNVLEAMLHAGVQRLMYASTMYVYSPYGGFYRASKQAAETIIETYGDEKGIDYTILRYGSLYGPGSQKWNGLRRYVEQVMAHESLKYWGTGEEVLEYIHVTDAARLTVDSLAERFKNRAVTITGQQSVKVDDMISLLFEICGKDRNVEYVQDDKNRGHYVSTPYRFTPKVSVKLCPDEYIDLGQGILQLIEEVAEKK